MSVIPITPLPRDLASTLTLNEVLARLDYTKQRFTATNGLVGTRILRDGALVITGNAGDVWDWLAETGQIETDRVVRRVD